MAGETSRNKIEYRCAEESDLPGIEALKSKVYGGASQAAWARRWTWQFVQHPWRPQGAPSNFLLAEIQGKLAGGIGWMPTFLDWGGAAYASAFGCDLFVDPETRGLGLGKLLIDRVVSDHSADSLWMNFDAAGARHYGKRGFTPVAPVNFLMLVVDPGRILKARGKGFLGALAGWTGGPVRALTRVRSRVSSLPSGVEIRAVTAFGEGFDRLDRALRLPDRVRLRRDASYLKWRYLDGPSGSSEIFAAEQGRDVLGYVVFRTRTNRGEEIGLINELEVDPRFPGLARALLGKAVQSLLPRKLSFIRAMPTHSEETSVFRGLGFLDTRRTPYLYVAPGVAQKLALPADSSRWCLSIGDSDLDYA
jgi:GNAT superfamily N-acetyltransferase